MFNLWEVGNLSHKTSESARRRKPHLLETTLQSKWFKSGSTRIRATNMRFAWTGPKFRTNCKFIHVYMRYDLTSLFWDCRWSMFFVQFPIWTLPRFFKLLTWTREGKSVNTTGKSASVLANLPSLCLHHSNFRKISWLWRAISSLVFFFLNLFQTWQVYKFKGALWSGVVGFALTCLWKKLKIKTVERSIIEIAALDV